MYQNFPLALTYYSHKTLSHIYMYIERMAESISVTKHISVFLTLYILHSIHRDLVQSSAL